MIRRESLNFLIRSSDYWSRLRHVLPGRDLSRDPAMARAASPVARPPVPMRSRRFRSLLVALSCLGAAAAIGLLIAGAWLAACAVYAVTGLGLGGLILAQARRQALADQRLRRDLAECGRDRD